MDGAVGALAAAQHAFEDWSRQIAREFHVSTVMVARQLWQHEAIGREQFFHFYDREKQQRTSKQAAGSGGNYYLTAPIRNSRHLTQSILASVEASETSIREASRLLGVKPANLPKLEEYMGVGGACDCWTPMSSSKRRTGTTALISYPRSGLG